MHYLILDYNLSPYSHEDVRNIVRALSEVTGTEIKLPTQTVTERQLDEDGNEVEVEVEVEIEKEEGWTVDEIRELLMPYADVVEVQVLNEPKETEDQG